VFEQTGGWEAKTRHFKIFSLIVPGWCPKRGPTLDGHRYAGIMLSITRY